MKNKFLFLFLIGLMVMALGAVADTNGTINAVTITTPTASSYVTDSYTFTGTFTGNVSTGGNISIFYNETFICADTTGLANVASGTWSCSGSLSGVDAGECVALYLNASSYNGTENVVESTVAVANIYSDATAPSTPVFSFTHGTIKAKGRNFFSCTSTDVCDSSPSWQISLTDPKSSVKTNKTSPTGSSAYFDGSDTDEQGTYTSTCSATDDAGNVATSSSATFRVSGSANAIISTGITEAKEEALASSNFILFLITIASVLVLIFLLAGGWFIIKGKKK